MTTSAFRPTPVELRPDGRRGGDAPEAAGGLKARGAFVLILASAMIGGLIGFVISGNGTVPLLAGWGLLIGSVLAALLSPPKLGWTVAWLPPLAMLATVAVLGQVTLMGSTPSMTRQVAMIAASLTALAPAQLLSVVAAAGILWLQHRRPRAGGRLPVSEPPATPSEERT